jgi:hypothetical protein
MCEWSECGVKNVNYIVYTSPQSITFVFCVCKYAIILKSKISSKLGYHLLD